MGTYEIPLIARPSEFTLTVADRDFAIRTYYRDAPEAGWHMDFSDDVNQAWKIAGIPFVTGLDLLMQYRFLLLNFELWIHHDLGADMPMFDELGTIARLYLVTANV